MTTYSFDPVSASLLLSDTPIGYTPPRGPAINFTVSYMHRDSSQPANFNSGNFGMKWNFNWTTYVTEDSSNPNATVSLNLPGGGVDYYSQFNIVTRSFAPQTSKRTILTRTLTNSYILLSPDGSRSEFARAVGDLHTRRFLLTRMTDCAGNSVGVIYDAASRLAAIQDAIGQVSSFHYDLPSDGYKITRIIDPFGRTATFKYDGGGRLTNITDVIGINSSFTYQNGDFINSLSTPYGTSSFRAGLNGTTAWLEMTDPLGATERVEFRNEAPGLAFTDPLGPPAGINAFNQYMSSRNTFYWDKQAFQQAGADYAGPKYSIGCTRRTLRSPAQSSKARKRLSRIASGIITPTNLGAAGLTPECSVGPRGSRGFSMMATSRRANMNITRSVKLQSESILSDELRYTPTPQIFSIYWKLSKVEE